MNTKKILIAGQPLVSAIETILSNKKENCVIIENSNDTIITEEEIKDILNKTKDVEGKIIILCDTLPASINAQSEQLSKPKLPLSDIATSTLINHKYKDYFNNKSKYHK